MSCTCRKTCELSEDGQKLRLKHVEAIIINKNAVQQVGVEYCTETVTIDSFMPICKV